MGSKEYKHFNLKFSKNWKYPKNDYLNRNWSKMTPQSVKMSKYLTVKYNFRGHLSTFGVENKTKSGPFMVKNNAQTLRKQLQNNFEKVQKTSFLIPKIPKTRVSTWQKVSILGSIFDLRALFLTCWSWKKIIIVPPENIFEKNAKKNSHFFQTFF